MFLALIVLAGCSSPDDTMLARDFTEMHPDCSLLDASVGEGDAEHAYVQFEYRCGGAAVRREQALYRRHGGHWTRVER